MTNTETALLAVGGVAMVAGAVYVAVTPSIQIGAWFNVAPHAFTGSKGDAMPGTPAPAELRERIISIQSKWRATAPPADAWEVPIVGMMHTYPANRPASGRIYERPADFLAGLNAIRSGLQACGRGDEDARAVMYLHVHECDWYRSMWNNNVGNRKTHPWATPAGIRAGVVKTNVPGCTGVFILKDRAILPSGLIGSTDFYPCFASLTDGLREEKGWMLRNGYANTIAGYVVGGVEGCIAASRNMQARGYSSFVMAQREADIRGFWRNAERRLGPGWVR